MKRLTLLTICALLALKMMAQAPQGISHQAVIRNANNQLVTESPIGIQVSIIQDSPDGSVVYSETHLPTSNANGLISFVIGQGTVAGGFFPEIDWAVGTYFIKTEADPAGGTNYTITGISQVLSVPYALHSKTAEALTTLYSETDPVFNASPANSITNTKISNWDDAFSWGNHHLSGYVRHLRTLSINGTTHDLTANRSWDVGTVTSVGLSLPHIFNVSGSPVTESGTLSVSFASQAANRVFASPNFSNGTPSFRELVANDIPNLNWSKITTGKPTTIEGYGITDAMSTSHAANGITTTNMSNWSTAFGWGNHATAGYLTSFTETDPTVPAHVKSITTTNISNWNTAHTHSTTTTGSVHGSTTVGGNLLRLTNPSAIRFLRINADNSISAMNAVDFRSAIGAGTGNGTVTSIATDNGITGGIITSTGTLGLTGQALALHNLSANGFISRTGAGTVAARLITSGTGITIANGNGVSGNPTIGLAGQALAFHDLSSSGIVVRTGSGTVSARTITAGTGITVTNGNGVSGNPAIAAKTYAVGDFAHGGIVFWIDATGQHGLVCAKADQSTGVRWYAGSFGNTRAYGDGPLAGRANTSIIIAAHVAIGDDGSTYAARICNELQITEGGITYGDWYLPSTQELNLMYINRTAINSTATANGGSGFASEYYWSSSEHSLFIALLRHLGAGNQGSSDKYNNYYVRAVRAF